MFPAAPFYVARATGTTPFLIKIDAAPGSDEYRAGLRSGDLLDVRSLTPAERYRWISVYRRAGQRLDLPVVREGKTVHVSIVTELIQAGWDGWLACAGFVWTLVFAAVIAWRRSDSSEARILSLMLSTLVIGSCLFPLNWITPWPQIDILAALAGCAIWGLSTALLATYSMTFAPPANLLRRIMMWLAYASAAAIPAYGAAFVAGSWTGAADPMQGWYEGSLSQFVVGVLPPGFAVLCIIATIAQTRGTDRMRLVWAGLAVGLIYFSEVIAGLMVTFNTEAPSEAVLLVLNVAIFLAPIGLTYVVISRRILDIGFALNRAIVFSSVSLVLVAAFFLVEWALGNWLNGASHTTNLIVGAAIALLLGFSVRGIHQRVDNLLDTVFFRKRHEDERALRDFAHEAAYITDPADLLDRTRAILESHADTSSVGILLDDGRGHYGEASENDPAIVSLRAWRKRVDLHAVDTAITGEFAFPMVARGRLVGAIVLGPKRSGDPYAPDESDAIAHLAHGVGGAVDVLSANGHASEDLVLAELQTISRDLKTLTSEIRALRSND